MRYSFHHSFSLATTLDKLFISKCAHLQLIYRKAIIIILSDSSARFRIFLHHVRAFLKCTMPETKLSIAFFLNSSSFDRTWQQAFNQPSALPETRLSGNLN